MEYLIAITVIIFGIINVSRVASHIILGDVYDQLFSIRRLKKHKSPYRPWISIIISAFNEEQVIESCLQSIYKSTYKKFEVIVINDGSTDKTSEKVRNFVKEYRITNLKLLEQSNGGKATALNYGIKNYATGKLIMTLDADSILDKGALQKATLYFRNRKVAALASNVRILKQKKVLSIIQYIEYLLGYRLKKAYTVLNNEYIIGGIGSIFRKSVLKHVDYYDTNTITEDIDLTMKIVSQGNKNFRLVYASDVLCFTQAVQSVKDLYRQRYRWKYGRFQTLWKNKKLFFNTSSKYTKMLTFFQLPLVLYSEVIFLFDPLFLLFLIYIELKYHEVGTFLAVLSFLAGYTCITLISDEYSTIKEKMLYLLLTPFAYFFFLLVSIVEYFALINCIIKNNDIFSVEKNGTCHWTHVSRAQLNTSINQI